jgi:hypothetical protein
MNALLNPTIGHPYTPAYDYQMVIIQKRSLRGLTWLVSFATALLERP